jgi:4'-phosphopantetheinyl transferase
VRPMPGASWESVHAVPELRAGEVHVWRDDLRASPPWADGTLLLADERALAGRMAAVERREAFVRGRAALRYLAGRYLNLDPREVPVRVLAMGKPVVALSDEATRLEVSIAHSGSVVAVAFTRAGIIGIDVEREDPTVDRAAIARRFFSPDEAQSLAALDQSTQLEAFFSLWVRKEAMLKAVGDGLSVPLAEVEFSVARSREPALRRVPAAYGRAGDWALRSMAPIPGAAGVVAVRGQVTCVRCMQYATSSDNGG